MNDTVNLNGTPVYYSTRDPGVTYIPLPPALWRPCGPCHCPHCHSAEGHWDTLVIPTAKSDKAEYSFTIHFPELQPGQFTASTRTWITRHVTKKKSAR